MSPSRPTVAIVGGGFSGAAVAYHLARANVPASLIVFEPRARIGAGLAYGGDDPVYRVNVPATRMSLEPSDDTHFARWLASSGVLAQDPGALSGVDAFPRRQDFGRYVDQALRPFLAEGRVRHVREAVVSLRLASDGWLVRTTRGRETFADLVVIATTHPGPALPHELRGLSDDPRLVPDPLADGALDPVAESERVLVVGSGLTAADIIAALDARGHRGRIVMISRRGLRSLGHAPRPFPLRAISSQNPRARRPSFSAPCGKRCGARRRPGEHGIRFSTPCGLRAKAYGERSRPTRAGGLFGACARSGISTGFASRLRSPPCWTESLRTVRSNCARPGLGRLKPTPPAFRLSCGT